MKSLILVRTAVGIFILILRMIEAELLVSCLRRALKVLNLNLRMVIGSFLLEDLMSLNQFYNADVIGSEKLPYLFSNAETGRFWMDMVWRVDPDIPSGGANKNVCNAFVKSCVGLALGGVDKTRVLETEDDTILYYARRKLGAVLIDPTGVLKINVTHA